MANQNDKRRKPPITILRSDHDALTRLAGAIADSNPAVSEELLFELDRARIVDAAHPPEGMVRMGSTLRYTTDTGEDRNVTLVYPAEADIEFGRVSVLTPIGVALIGLSQGQSIDWTARDGRIHRLTVESVGPAVARKEMRQAS
ncbi:nucleoside diphosphate kinase regulator [Mesorhizobium sp. CN2-181]|uniref:nucleoside diphosphate kinase regulator n=1 Tax=Mesorhizobium yinganensis TaxID=3157707 RepID=UPI0032B80021